MSPPSNHQPPPNNSPQKRFMPPPPQEKTEPSEHTLASLSMRSKSPALGAARFTERCSNCERPLNVEGTDAAVVTDAGGVYCSKNCSWAAAVDPGGVRLRAARRAKTGKPVKKRKKRVPMVFDDSDKEGERAGNDRKGGATMCGESNAMFEFHQMMFGGLDLDEEKEEEEGQKMHDQARAHKGGDSQ